MSHSPSTAGDECGFEDALVGNQGGRSSPEDCSSSQLLIALRSKYSPSSLEARGARVESWRADLVARAARPFGPGFTDLVFFVRGGARAEGCPVSLCCTLSSNNSPVSSSWSSGSASSVAPPSRRRKQPRITSPHSVYVPHERHVPPRGMMSALDGPGDTEAASTSRKVRERQERWDTAVHDDAGHSAAVRGS